MNQGGECVRSLILITRTIAKPSSYGQWNPLMSSSPPVHLCNALNWCFIIWCKWLNKFLVKLLLFSDLRSLLYRSLITGVCTLPAQYTDKVDLKDGLLNNRVFALKFPVVESCVIQYTLTRPSTRMAFLVGGAPDSSHPSKSFFWESHYFGDPLSSRIMKNHLDMSSTFYPLFCYPHLLQSKNIGK